MSQISDINGVGISEDDILAITIALSNTEISYTRDCSQPFCQGSSVSKALTPPTSTSVSKASISDTFNVGLKPPLEVKESKAKESKEEESITEESDNKQLVKGKSNNKQLVKGEGFPYVIVIIVHDSRWVIIYYQDGSTVLNHSYIFAGNALDAIRKSDLTPGRSPYCFLISLWDHNQDFMLVKGYTSPHALLQALDAAGLSPIPNKMYEHDTIIPVARFLKATIYVAVFDGTREMGEQTIHGGENFLMVKFDIKGHYVNSFE